MLMALVAVVAVLLTVYYFCRSPSNLPPGPTGVPILGYLPFLDSKRPYLTMDKLSKVYGPVTSLYLGSVRTVVLGDYQTIRAALQENAFSGRPTIVADRAKIADRQNITFASGKFWQEHRRFALSTLRDFGIGKVGLEPMVLSEIECFLKELSKNPEEFDISELLFVSVSNIICSLVFGKRFEYNDSTFQHLLKVLKEVGEKLSGTAPDMFLPWLRKIPGVKTLIGYDDFLRVDSFVFKAVGNLYKSHKYETGSKANYLDAFLTERTRRAENGEEDFFGDEALVVNLQALFGAGTDTTSSTLMWVILYMILHPDIQSKVQQEIDDVIGRERMPSLEDRQRMPYTDATIMEIQRKSTIAPLAVPHETLENVSFKGYHIPKGTFILPNLWAVHNDPQLYPDPDSFRPERFINQDGQAVKPEYLITFGVGKRFCLGEPLARMELFLYFTSMLQKFRFVKPEGVELTTEPEGSLVEHPAALTKVQVVPRY